MTKVTPADTAFSKLSKLSKVASRSSRVYLSESSVPPLFRQGQEFLRSERTAELVRWPNRHPSKLERLE